MIIPITIGYKDDKKVIKDLAELGHLLVHLYENQMDFIRNSKDFIYEKLKSDNYDVFPIYFDLKDQTNMARMYHKIEENYKIMIDRLDMFDKEKCKSINEYNDTHNDNLKHIVLLIYGYLNKEYLGYKDIDDRLSLIVQSGKNAGVHMIVITDNTIDMCDDVIFGLNNIVSTNDEYERRRYVIPKDALLDNNFDGSNIEEDHIYEMAKNELAFDCGILGKTCYLTFKKEDYIDID